MPATRAIDLETLRRFDRPGPRYTSYPTAVELDESVGGEAYREHLAEIDRAEPEAPISLYVHVPFCRKRCRFCACHVIATPHEEVAEPYLDALEREIAAVAEALPRRRRVAQMHWGAARRPFSRRRRSSGSRASCRAASRSSRTPSSRSRSTRG